ncbi:MAG: HD domain-containing phosphohydrolase [Pseudomonadales bacterium]
MSQDSAKREENNAYLKHLTAVNNSNPVIVTENVLDEDGALLLKQGSRINEQATERLLKFKLLKPIEESIGLENSLTGDRIHQEMLLSCNQNPTSKALYESCQFDDVLQKMCQSVEQYPILIQKLTVHALQRPKEFHKATMCAWMSIHIGNAIGLTQEQLLCLFLAALTHDIGMLHIDRAITEKQGDLTAEEWQSMQCHVIIGEKIIRGIGLPASCSRAILEHHERCDGSGYPKSITREELSIEGQIIAMCDMIVAVIKNRLSIMGSSVVDLIPILQVNSEIHFYHTYETIVLWLRTVTKNNISPQLTEQEANERIKQIKALRREVVDRLDIINEVLRKITADKKNKKIQAIIISIEQLDSVLTRSGVLYFYYVHWLEHSIKTSDTSAFTKIDYSLIILNETKWRLRHIERNLKLFHDHGNNASISTKQAINDGLKQLAKY